MLGVILASALAGISMVQTGGTITLAERLPLGGYTDRKGALMEEGPGEVHLRLVSFKSEDDIVVVGILDALTIPESLVREVRKQIPPYVRLFLHATHTHSAPDSQMLNDRMTLSIPGIANYKRRVLEKYANTIATLIRSNIDGPGWPTWVRDYQLSVTQPGLNRARRRLASPDPRAVTLSMGGLKLVWYTAHPTVLGPENNKIDGDWPGRLMQSHSVIAFNGPLGDVSPGGAGSPKERLEEFAKKLTPIDNQTLPSRLIVPLRWAEAPINLPPKVPHPTFAKAYGATDGLARMLVDRFAPPAAAVSAFRLGKVAIVGTPCEPTSEVGRRIALAGRNLGFDWTLVVPHVNGWAGYVLTPEDYRRGGYEAQLSFYGEQMGDRLVEACVEALRNLSGRAPRKAD